MARRTRSWAGSAGVGFAGILSLACVVSDLRAQPEWVRIGNGRIAAIAFDTARSRMVAVTGPDWFGYSDTWEWDGTAWFEMRPAHRPLYGVLVYQAHTGTTVLFSSVDTNATTMSTWEWDGRDWRRLSTSRAPSPRSTNAFAYDPGLRRTLLYGGSTAGLTLTDTWEWDGATWRELFPPSAPTNHVGLGAMCYDGNRGRLVLLTRESTSFNATCGFWEWDGRSWNRILASTGIPTGSLSSMCWDPQRRKVVLASLVDKRNGMAVWEWDGSAWTPRALREELIWYWLYQTAYDPLHGKVLCLTATWPTPRGRDLWSWDGARWESQPDPNSERRRSFHGLAYDEAHGVTVLFGGFGSYDVEDVQAEWDGTRWNPRVQFGTPLTRASTAMTYDAGRDRTFLFGGADRPTNPVTFFDDTWEWDGKNWVRRATTVRPAARGGAAIAYDRARGRVVLFGGTGGIRAMADTWEWDGATWRNVTPATSPPGRSEAAMTYDEVRRRIVLFGGVVDSSQPGTYFSDTWEWDGAAWTQATPALAPPARCQTAMAYDAERKRCVLFGGIAPGPLDDAWEWDGARWQQLVLSPSPGARRGHKMVYDRRARSILLFGGNLAYVEWTEVWYLGDRAVMRAASSQEYGAGCPGTLGVPTLACSVPKLGAPVFHLDLGSARPDTPCVLGLALGRQSVQLGDGCTLLLRAPMLGLPARSNASGFATTHLALPGDPALCGTEFFLQGFVLDPLGSDSGLAASPGRAAVLGY